MIRKLAIANLALLALLLASAVVNAWTHGSIAQSILSSLQVTANPPTLGNPDSRYAVGIDCTTDSSNVNPDFSNTGCIHLTETSSNGNNINNGSTLQAKTTFSPLAIYSLNTAAGQRINATNENHCFGMGDCSAWGTLVYYAGGPVNGDEGQAYGLFAQLSQQKNLDTGIVSSVVRTTCNTTATQAITQNIAAQAVSVASLTGCNVNDWVIIDQQMITGVYAAEAVQITAVGGGKITGVFTLPHNNGTTVTPAAVITVSSTGGQLGQGRVLVNTGTASTYSTGTVSAINGGGYTGSGTTWTNGMVGGNSSNIGCIALTADDYSGAPFSGGSGTLKSWYQITTINSSTSLGMFSFSTAGDQAYHGNGPAPGGNGGAGGYIIRPCVQILKVISGTIAIAETTATTWTNGDTVEVSISPYPDVSGFSYAFNKWVPGGITRHMMLGRNGGVRSMAVGITLDPSMGVGVTGQDYIPWMTGYSCTKCAMGIDLGQSVDMAIRLDDAWGQGPLFTGTISGTTLTVSAITQGSIGVGEALIGNGVTAHTFIAADTGGGGGVGTYTVAIQGCPGCTQSVGSPTAMQAGHTDSGGKITWAGTGAWIMPNSVNEGLDIATLLPGGGLLQSKSSTKVGSGSVAALNYAGMIGTTAVAFASLPTCAAGLEGMSVAVNNSSTVTYNAAISGGGANHVIAYCNGTAWVAH